MLRLLTFLALALAAPACSSGGDPDPDGSGATSGVSVRDSASVRVVEITSDALAELPVWALPDVPTVSIGASVGAEPYMFGAISDAILLSDGRIAVADRQADEVRVFGADGTHRVTLGRRGDGPGEFQQPDVLGELADGGVGVYDRSHRRVTRFAASGAPTAEWTLTICTDSDPDRGGLPCLYPALGFFEDGSVLMANGAARATPGRDRRQRLVEGSVIELGRLYDLDWTPLDTIRQADLIYLVGPDIPTYMLPLTYGGAPSWTVSGPRAAYGNSSHPTISIRSSTGELMQIVRFGTPPRPVDTTDLDRIKAIDWTGRLVGPEWPDVIAELIDEFGSGPYVPHFGELMLDHGGRLWVADFRLPEITPLDTPQWWTALDPDGTPLARIELPASTMDVEGDAVLTLATDDMGVQSVRVYAIEKG